MRVLGIDPGSETLGWGVVEGSGSKYAAVEFGTVKASPKLDFSKRLLTMYNGVSDVIERFEPNVLSLEDAFYGSRRAGGSAGPWDGARTRACGGWPG